MRAADRSARGRTGRVLPGPRARIAAVAAGLGLLLLQPAVPGAETNLFEVTPSVLTVGETMTLEATLPPAEPPADPAAPAPDPSTYRYEWNLDSDPEPEKSDTGDAGRTITATVTPDSVDANQQTVSLRVVDPGADPTEIDDVELHNSGPQVLPVGYAPVASFVRSEPQTGSPRAGQTVTFTSTASDKDGDLDDSSRRWFIEGEEAVEARGQASITRSFPTFGDYKVEHEVKDNKGRKHVSSQTVSVAASPPVARFVFSPTAPTTDDTVEFDGRASSDPDGSELQFDWNIDDDGEFDDGNEATLKRRFEQPGAYTVALRVRDGSSEDVKTQTFTVRAVPAPPAPNVAPKASFTVAPRDPAVGQAVTLTSTATDSDGRIARVQWDLDNDGKFADGAPVNTTSFSRPGNHVVALKVFDDDGASATAFETVTVKAPQVVKPEPVRTLNPFPVIRIRGVILSRGVAVQILSVRAARGLRVSVRCRGRACPAKSYSGLLRRSGMRIKKFERMLRAGVVLEVRVTKRGWVGKYTRFTIRRRAAPRRVDLCVGPVSSRAVKCEG